MHLPIIDGNVTSDTALSRLADDCCQRILRGERMYIHWCVCGWGHPLVCVGGRLLPARPLWLSVPDTNSQSEGVTAHSPTHQTRSCPALPCPALLLRSWGGHGRTGTLVAVMLARLYGLTCAAALRYTQVGVLGAVSGAAAAQHAAWRLRRRTTSRQPSP